MPTIVRLKKKNYPKSEDSAKDIYNTPQWKNLRKAHIMQHPLCEVCLKEGKVTPAEEVHHITPILTGATLERRKELAFDSDNLMSLCKKHHIEIHKEMKRESY